MKMILKVGFFLSAMMLSINSCNEKEVIIEREYAKLVVRKYYRWYGNSSQRDKQIFEIFENKEDYNNCLAKHLNLNTVTDGWWYDFRWMIDYKLDG